MRERPQKRAPRKNGSVSVQTRRTQALVHLMTRIAFERSVDEPWSVRNTPWWAMGTRSARSAHRSPECVGRETRVRKRDRLSLPLSFAGRAPSLKVATPVHGDSETVIKRLQCSERPLASVPSTSSSSTSPAHEPAIILRMIWDKDRWRCVRPPLVQILPAPESSLT